MGGPTGLEATTVLTPTLERDLLPTASVVQELLGQPKERELPSARQLETSLVEIEWHAHPYQYPMGAEGDRSVRAFELATALSVFLVFLTFSSGITFAVLRLSRGVRTIRKDPLIAK